MKQKITLMSLTALVVFILDQLTKWWIVSSIQLGGNMAVIDGYIRLRYTQNTGAAFGFLRDGSGILSIVSPIVIASLVIVFVRLGNPTRLSTFAAGLIVGGALGNLIDRIRLGYVVDFIEVYNPHLNLGGNIYTFPVFNVGDSGITIGVILILIGLIFAKEEQPQAQAQTESTLDDQSATPSNTSASNHTHLAG